MPDSIRHPVLHVAKKTLDSGYAIPDVIRDRNDEKTVGAVLPIVSQPERARFWGAPKRGLRVKTQRQNHASRRDAKTQRKSKPGFGRISVRKPTSRSFGS